MKKFILSAFVLLSFGFYVVWLNNNNSSIDLSVPVSTDSFGGTKNNINLSSNSSKILNKNNPQTTTSNSNQNNIPLPAISTTTPPTVTTKKNGIYNDGEYTGDSIFAYNDYIQVKVIISSGLLTDIQFVQYPQSGRSGRISSFSLPTLKQEAIKAQSANINAVSGASYTSPAFIQSLSSALVQAKA